MEGETPTWRGLAPYRWYIFWLVLIFTSAADRIALVMMILLSLWLGFLTTRAVQWVQRSQVTAPAAAPAQARHSRG